VHIRWGRRYLLLRQLVFANWTNHVHSVVECALIESLTTLRLTRERVERLLLQLRLMVRQLLTKDFLFDVVVRLHV